jgi:hypothetical protein
MQTIKSAELKQIRNYVTAPVVQDARYWLNHPPRTHEQKAAYVDGLHNALALIFTYGSQPDHTIAAIEKLFFN